MSNDEFKRLSMERNNSISSTTILDSRTSILWIVKPANQNRGKGIFLTRSIDEIIQTLKSKN